MSHHKLHKAAKTLFKQIRKLYSGFSKAIVLWLFRSALTLNRQRHQSGLAAGFVLPTTILLLLVVSLTVGAMVFRAYNYTNLVMSESQQRVIYNAATPAVDRARAKLEVLFDSNRDNRYPGGVPAENYLVGMLRNDGSYNVSALPGASTSDQYTLPDEVRINLDGQTKTGETRAEDNAWAFRTDTNGDGTTDATVVYSILFQTPPDAGTPTVPGSGLLTRTDLDKSQNLWVRTAPLSNRQRGNCGVVNTQVSSAAQGWFQDLSNSSTLRKNFQIDAVVIPDNATSRNNFVALELQHDRRLDRGNKWGAWFRNDLEIFPGSNFNWNGAMHTEGSLIVAPQQTFTAFLVSAQASCLMSSASNSEITVTNIPNSTNAAGQKPDFIGGILSGSTLLNQYTDGMSGYSGTTNIHIWPAQSNQASQVATLTTSSQSANKAATTVNMALDPVALLTRDVSLARGSDTSNRTNVTANWQGLPSNKPRITNQAEPKPYVDDLYRADDRWGPKPRYSDQIVLNGTAQQPGTLITSSNVTKAEDLTSLISTTYDSANAANVGLDGYWERRARNEGLRIIVGHRLQLGNSTGWTNSLTTDTSAASIAKSDPLYPPKLPSGTTTTTHEALQRRVLRDNSAAVQSTAIYHSASTGGADFPVACLASTVHPGTATTLAKSINFANFQKTYYNSAGTAVTLINDFLEGTGTDGWEYAPPQGTETAFATAVAANQPLGRALRNLAYFAGDPDGAFPPLQEANKVHPNPLLTMWGNYSELRRTLKRMDVDNVPYSQLSLADKTNLHTAACTLGMLSYQISQIAKSDLNQTVIQTNINQGDKVNTGVSIWKNFENLFQNNANFKLQYCADASGNLRGDGSSSNPYVCDLPQVASISTTDPLLNGLNASQMQIASLIVSGQQIDRDRRYGFADSPVYSVGNTAQPFDVQGTGNKNYRFYLPAACDPRNSSTANPETIIFGYPPPNGIQDKQAGLSMLCSSKPRYPSLFYLFPKVDHDIDGNTTDGNNQPANEEYSSNSVIQGLNSGTTYKVVSGDATNPDDFSGVRITPRATDFSDWTLPNGTLSSVTGANVSPNLIVAPGGSLRAVGFLERAIFNGREMMTTRVMDLDLGMLRNKGITASQPWLPISGIVYAFREDAAREDGIARPPGGAGTQTSATSISSPTDPTLATTAEGIQLSTKQVDYIPDPARRPHGFRLRNGAQLKRNSSFGIATTDNIRGLSFFTDDPVYIQGDFNLHQDGTDDTVGSKLEEFDEQLPDRTSPLYSDAEFYGRSTRSSKFAQPDKDRWRPTEILADAISVLSYNFCDGSLEDSFPSSAGVTETNYHNISTPGNSNYGLFGPGCTSGGKTSYINQNRPQTNSSWLRENANDTTSPVKVDRNGNPLVSGGTAYSGNYDTFSTSKGLMTATDSTVNTIFVSGIVPSRANQAYGGLHNFPRFLETWSGKRLRFNGSFLQLSFSNYATGPYDQDAWEPSATPSSTEYIQYYVPPARLWGYDPALQLAPAGPAAARFVTASRNRNEFYLEPSISDPYVNRLCQAFNSASKTGTLAGAPATVTCP